MHESHGSMELETVKFDQELDNTEGNQKNDDERMVQILYEGSCRRRTVPSPDDDEEEVKNQCSDSTNPLLLTSDLVIAPSRHEDQ